MEDLENLAKRVLLNQEYSNVLQFVCLTTVSFNQLNPHSCLANTFHKYVVFQNEQNRIFSKRGHCRIGKPLFIENTSEEHNGLEGFEQRVESHSRDFYRLNVQYINAKHIVWGQPESRSPESVNNILMRLIDEYMPTGILNIDQVLRAEDTLHEIWQKLVANENIGTNLSEKFYQMISQNEYYEPLEIINNRRIYRIKINALDRLRSALEAINAGIQKLSTNPIDYFARNWLRTELHEVDQEIFLQLHQCTQAAQHPNDRYFRLASAFKVTASADIEFANDIPNQHLLYYYTFPSKILGILRDGLQITPSPSHNRSLGDGIYFWDCAPILLHKFINTQLPDISPILLVCRVALGAVHDVSPSGNVLQLPNNVNSFLWEGNQFPSMRSNAVNIDGAEMYCGEIDRFYGAPDFDYYNMYMVQNKHQVKIEYILQFQQIS